MKKTFWLGVVLALVTLCAAFSAEAGVTIQSWTAPSGAKVVFVENHALPILDVQVDFAAGGLYASRDKAGIAGLTAGLLDSGVSDGGALLDEEQIAGRKVDLGLSLATSADTDRASVTLRTLTSAAEREGALVLLAAVLSQPTFPDAVLAREKSRAIAAIQEADTRPDALAEKIFNAAIYGAHPYGNTVTAETLASISRADVVAYYQQHYQARTAVVSLIGAISRAQAEAIAQRLTAALPQGATDGGTPTQLIMTQPQAQVLRIAHPASQSHILIGQPALVRGSADYFPLLVGNYVLGGGGFVSRLMNEVREKRGLVYDVHSYFAPRKQEGPFEIGLQTRRDQADAALGVVNQVLTGFLKDGPTATELRAAKQNLATGLALRLDSNQKMLGYLALIGYYNLPLTYLDDYPAKIRAVTAKQVKEAFARHVRPENLVTVVVAADLAITSAAK